MRFNKAELVSLVTNPKTNFEKEGLLIITERQEGFFRKNDVNHPRWCKLRGNLLFYLKNHEPNSQPAGLLVLENCRPIIKTEEREFDGYAFILEFIGSWPQRICARTSEQRLEWVKCIQLASYTYLDRQIKFLKEQIKLATASQMGNHIETGQIARPVEENNVSNNNDNNHKILFHDNHYSQHQQPSQNPQIYRQNNTSIATTLQNKMDQEDQLSEVPLCETSLSCDSLPKTENGRRPNTRIVCAIPTPGTDMIWQDYARTEIIEQSTNPHFLCTICFRQSDGFHSQTPLRFTIYDVREKVSSTMVPIGYAEILLGVIQDATHFRIPLRSMRGECGFITISSWTPDRTESSDIPRLVPPRSITQVFDEQQIKSHRRSQSLPPKFGVKLFVPYHGGLQHIFTNATRHTYRLQSSLGADIRVNEVMLESKLCFIIPQQLLSIWIAREKELLQEISGMGELGGIWRCRQMDLLDKHLKLLKNYSQAKQNLQQLTNSKQNLYFKQSSIKNDSTLEFVPVNLHLQRMCAQTDALLHPHNQILDIITVGAFTRHQSKKSNVVAAEINGHGGLIKLLQEHKISSPSKMDSNINCKVQAANDAVQAIKQLRTEIVQIMSNLLLLAKHKHSEGMMPMCNELINKTKTLLNLWEPNLVEETFTFIEQHRILEESDLNNTNKYQLKILPQSNPTILKRYNQLLPNATASFRQITQQLDNLALKSPDLEDFATPLIAPPDLWPTTSTTRGLVNTNNIFDENYLKDYSYKHQHQNSGNRKENFYFSTKLLRSNSLNQLNMKPSPSIPLDLGAIQQLQQNIRKYNEEISQKVINPIQKPPRNNKNYLKSEYNNPEESYQSLPIILNENAKDEFVNTANNLNINENTIIKNNMNIIPNVNIDDDLNLLSNLKYGETTTNANFDLNANTEVNKIMNTNNDVKTDLIINNNNNQIFKSNNNCLINVNNKLNANNNNDNVVIVHNNNNEIVIHTENNVNTNLDSVESSNVKENLENRIKYIDLEIEYPKEIVEFLDTKEMSTSPSANFYRPSEEPEPLDLTQLNIEASVMCLVSKIKFLCGRRSSPAIRLRHPKTERSLSKGSSRIPDVIDNKEFKMEIAQEGSEENIKITNGLKDLIEEKDEIKEKIQNFIKKPNDLDLTQPRVVHRKGNKFTDGLDLSLTTDWSSELRPSMRKLRHAMDGLLKTARLMHSVTRLHQDMIRITRDLEIMYRRDVCFSQSLTALITALMAKLWGNEITADYIRLLFDLGPLAYFEGLLSLHGSEIDMWGDMCVAIEDLASINFTLICCPTQHQQQSNQSTDYQTPTPRIFGTRQNMQVYLPVMEYIYNLSLSLKRSSRKDGFTFNITPVFFNIGINERATIAETIGQTRDQHRSNCDNFSRLKQYYSRFRKLPGRMDDGMMINRSIEKNLNNCFEQLEDQLKSNVSKNVKILHLAEDICRLLGGLRFTSCKSAKDRTGMAVTLEECRLLVQEFQLPSKNVPNVLNTLRCEGTRMDNVYKNITKWKYAFNLPQVLSLPAMYRPPVGSYGKAET